VNKPFDATSKEMLQTDPVGWAAFLGVARPPDQIKLIDSDLSTVTATAGKVLKIEDARPWTLDVEFQSWREPADPGQFSSTTPCRTRNTRSRSRRCWSCSVGRPRSVTAGGRILTPVPNYTPSFG
jgi:hypothetical protein